MAVRTPLYLNGTDLQEMSASMITAIIHRCVYLYGGSPSVRLAYVSNSGSLRRMLDRRDRPGTEANNSTTFSNNNTFTVEFGYVTNSTYYTKFFGETFFCVAFFIRFFQF